MLINTYISSVSKKQNFDLFQTELSLTEWCSNMEEVLGPLTSGIKIFISNIENLEMHISKSVTRHGSR